MAPTKRTILITGCSNDSLGSHLALAFHQTTKWRVFASARSPAKLTHLTAAGIETLQLDILSPASLAASVAHVAALTGGTLDALLNNAGGGLGMPLMDVDLDKVRALFELNFFSVLAVTKAFLPLLLEATAAHGGAMVINNTSVSSLTSGGMPFAGSYNASKAATASLTETLRLELAPFGIKVVNLVTGSVKSTFFANAVPDALPEDSIYNIAKERIETTMSGSDARNGAADPVAWATQVVHALSKNNPSHWVWAGKWSSTVRLFSLLPIGASDSIVKSLVGLDVLEQKIAEQKSVKVGEENLDLNNPKLK